VDLRFAVKVSRKAAKAQRKSDAKLALNI